MEMGCAGAAGVPVGVGAGSVVDGAASRLAAVGVSAGVAVADGAVGVAVLVFVSMGTGTAVGVAGGVPSVVAVTATVVLAGPGNAVEPAPQAASTRVATSSAIQVGVTFTIIFFAVTSSLFIPVHSLVCALLRQGVTHYKGRGGRGG